ncbi:MAG: S-layer homology domain-containing protein, partial [Acetivibrio ethanolgignens]
AIFGGAAKDEVENTNITMTGGLVSYIYGGGDSGAVKGDTSVTVTGGEVGTVHGGAYDGDVKGNAYINIGKEAKTDAIYGWGDSDKPVGGKSYGYVEEAEGLSWGRTESFDNLLWKQEDGNWSVQGNPFIPEGFTTTISETKKLVVPAGFTLTCKGTLLNRGTVENNGTIKNDGKIQNFGKISGNGEIKGTPVEDSNPSTSDEGNTSGGDSASGGGNTSGGGNVSGGGGNTSGGGNVSGGGGNTSGGGNVSGGGGSTSGGSTSKDDTSGTTPPVATEKPESVTKPAATTVKATYQGSKATATLSKSTVNKAIKEAKAEAEKSGKEADEIAVTIQADTDKAKNFAFNLPKATVSELVENEVKEISIRNDVSTITLDRDTLKEIQKQVNKDVTATINKVNNSTLSASAKKKVGKRPVYDFSITAKNGKKVTDFGNGKVKISIPYKLGVNEKASNLVVYYINDKGKTQEMPNSVYNEEAKAISFVTDHFSKFAVGYKTGTTTFKDITTHWAKESIEFVTARGILEGTGKTEFSPDKAVTKELMAATLGRIANADVSKYKKSSFSDVKTKSSYFGYIVWADKKGIIKGDTKTTFVPNKTITHEQMAVIMVNYAKAMGFDLPKLREEKAFADQDKISNSAKSAVKKLQMAGILNEREGSSFDPQGILTRAELSTVLKHFVEAISGTGTGQ